MHFSEITASSLVKVDLEGNIVQDTEHVINPAGFVIHSAIHAARQWVDGVTRHPAVSIRGAVQIVRAAREENAGAVKTERDVFARLWGGDAHQRALDHVKAGG